MNLSALAESLKAGEISLSQWESSMRDYLREQYTVGMILTKGGRDNITQADWGYMGSALKKQYNYLGGFARDIANDPQAWLSGRLDYRMNLYKESAYTALEDFNRREHRLAGYDEERRVLGQADHCDDCLDAAAQGWQPIGTLPAIGDSVCIVNCKCEFEYRKSGGIE
jgi:hypothetical protein